MKKVLFVSLLFVSVFLIGSLGVAADGCYDYQDYTCTASLYAYGDLDDTGTGCVTLCYDDSFGVGIDENTFLGISGFLYPATSYEHLLGTVDAEGGLAGCSVDFKGRSIIVKVGYIGEDSGEVGVSNCTPCNSCCHDM